MADSWTTPATYATDQVVGAPDLNLIRDNLDALKQALKDASVDADLWQAVKSGTLSARSGVAHQVGRQYFATDVLANYVSDGTRWQHLTGRGAFDSFDRTTSSTLGNAESGHLWVEDVPDIQINASAELENVSGTAIATVDTGGVLHTASYLAVLASGGTIGSFDALLILKYIDANNYLYVALQTASIVALGKREAGAFTTLISTAPTLTSSTGYVVKVQLRGSLVWVEVYVASGAGLTSFFHDDDENVMGGYINTATKCGVRLSNTTNSKCGAFSVVPNG